VVLPETGPDGAGRMAERLRELIANRAFDLCPFRESRL
jgi:hypothetical protein